MNKVVLMGRLTRNPEVRYSQGNTPTAVARYSLAVNRRFKRDGQPDADFINCVAFGKQGEFAEKYFKKGTKIVVSGRLQTGSYVNREGQKVYTTDVVIEEQDFCESKGAEGNYQPAGGFDDAPAGRPEPSAAAGAGFMNIPDGIENELPFG